MDYLGNKTKYMTGRRFDEFDPATLNHMRHRTPRQRNRVQDPMDPHVW